MKRFCSILIVLIAGIWACNAQSITNATISVAGGEFVNNNAHLNFTIGEPFASIQSMNSGSIGTGFWSVVSAGYIPTATSIYRFTGNGNFSDPANWEGNIIPPNPLPQGSEILINPAGAGQCVINAPYSVSPGGKFSVITGKKLVINGNLTLTRP